jgi:ATP-binding cassette, subfamily B, bacterial MsbA
MSSSKRESVIEKFRQGSGARLIREHVRPHARWLVVAVVWMAVFAATTAGQAWLMEPMLDQVFLDRNQSMLVLVPLAVIGLAVVKAFADYGQTMALSRVGQRVSADLQQRLFRHLIRADLRYFVERGPGPLISGMTYDTQQLRNTTSTALTGLARDSLTIIFLVALMFHQD